MLKKLIIKNFQKHKKLEIELDPKITTIIGPTDAGKSAIIRALRWCLLNKPSGESFRRHGSGRTNVALQLEGARLDRTRSNDLNLYKFRGNIYQAFGAKVPDTISKKLRISDNNFQGQHDTSFWLSESPGHVAKELNKIVDLSIIDVALANIIKEVKRAKTVIEVSEQRLESARQEVKTLKIAKVKDKKLRVIQGLADDLANLQAKRASGSLLVERGLQLKTLVDNELVRRVARRKLDALAEKYQNSRERTIRLRALWNRTISLEGNICSHQEQLKQIRKKMKSIIGNQCPVCGTVLKK